MNYLCFINFYIFLAVARCTVLSIDDYLAQLRKKPRYSYQTVDHDISSASSRENKDEHLKDEIASKWKRIINSGHKSMLPFRSAKHLGRPISRGQQEIGLSKVRERVDNILKESSEINRTEAFKKQLIRTFIRNKHLMKPASPNTDPRIPRIGGLHPGHTLLKPKGRTLNSAATYPKDNTNHLVYGNPDNFGITYNKTRDRVLYSDFRRMNYENDYEVENTLLKAILQLMYYQKQGGHNNSGVVVIGIEPNAENNIDDTSNEASEVMDLRKRYKDHVKIDRESKYLADNKTEDTTSESGDGSSKDFERNPGNPYTLHRNRYKQNWLWNHFMDGDHMNIDPYGPKIQAVGPTGIDLFFGRKWWYFNQDDYKPLG